MVLSLWKGEISVSSSYLTGLTEAQKYAVTFGEGPLLVVAGPGSGKTRVITCRIAFLLEAGIRPDQILALTFTNKAAQEIVDRVVSLTGQKGIWIGTFHGFCARLLRRYARLVGLEDNFTIYDDGDSLRVLRRAVERTRFPLVSPSLSDVAAAIHRAKNQLQLPEFFVPKDSAIPPELWRQVYAAYQEELRRQNAVDFDDLLLHVARILGEHPDIRRELDDRFRFILVDEYQDTNLAQYAIARALSIDYPNLTVTGDPDQSIYRWRGATLRNILEFEKDYPHVTVVRLEENYRSTGRILRVADALIARNRLRKPKQLFTQNPEGRPVRVLIFKSEQEEALGIAEEIFRVVRSRQRRFRDFAVFFRLNVLSRPLEAAFRQRGIPYQVVNGTEFFRRKEIQDLLAYLRIVVNPRDDEAFARICQIPPRAFGARTLDRVREFARQRGLSLAEAIQEEDLFRELSPRMRKPLREFAEVLRKLTEIPYGGAEAFVRAILNQSGYLEYLKAEGTPEAQERLANVEEFISVTRQFDLRHPDGGTIEQFLEEVALASDPDRWDETDDCVALMTLHAAKGLEFPVVYIVGLEQGLLPYEDSWRDVEELEEERRLLFVGITRAREEVTLTRAVFREFRGQRRLTIPSPFLLELPRGEIEIEDRSEEQVGFVLEGTSPVGQRPQNFEVDQGTEGFLRQEENSRKPEGRLYLAKELSQHVTHKPAPETPVKAGSLVLHVDHGLGRVVEVGEDEGEWLEVEFVALGRNLRLSRGDPRLRILPRKNT
jgi:DNA helicase-2/ATP-dependent DNA helicase PcrA